MKIGIVGGGINGLCVASEALKKGHEVTLFERGSLMSETSANSSKLLHGGLRYLENFEFRLVRESLKERKYWLNKSSELTHPLRFYLPVYKTSRRPAWMVRVGLYLYDILAGKHAIQKHRKEDIDQFSQQFPQFNKSNLSALYSYSDGQMDDKNLGLMLADELRDECCKIIERSPVSRLESDGKIHLESGECHQFDKVINVAGPWAEDLLQRSDISTETHLDLIRGSHIIIDRPLDSGFILEVPNEERVFFVLPHHGKTLVGTTEVRQSIDEPIKASVEEISYLLAVYQYYFNNGVTESDIVGNYAGVRPLLISHKNPNKASREYVIEQNGEIITVFGGKWTTSRALGEKLARKYL
jgi:glycerol-3-phosphate dehydrogenase